MKSEKMPVGILIAISVSKFLRSKKAKWMFPGQPESIPLYVQAHTCDATIPAEKFPSVFLKKRVNWNEHKITRNKSDQPNQH